LGCYIVGTDAATLIQEAANVMRARGGVDAITQSIYVHPALPEVLQRGSPNCRSDHSRSATCIRKHKERHLWNWE